MEPVFDGPGLGLGLGRGLGLGLGPRLAGADEAGVGRALVLLINV